MAFLPEHLNQIFSYLKIEDLKSTLVVCKAWTNESIRAYELEVKLEEIVRYARENLLKSFNKSGGFFTRPTIPWEIKFDKEGYPLAFVAANIKSPQIDAKTAIFKITTYPYCKADAHPVFCRQLTDSQDCPTAFENDTPIEVLPRRARRVALALLERLNAVAEAAREKARREHKDWFSQVFSDGETSLDDGYDPIEVDNL